MKSPVNIIHTPNMGFHFIWRKDLESVIRYGILSRYFIWKCGQGEYEPIFKAQRQAGIDLISIWDPWVFLRRHWRNRPLGSDNRPWDIIDFRMENYFQDPQDICIARSMRDPDPATWIGVDTCQQMVSRRNLDKIRRKIASLAAVTGPAPGLTKSGICEWINQELHSAQYDDEPMKREVCLLLRPELRRYDFPGYKKFENFVRFRIRPGFILGVITNAVGVQDDSLMETATSAGYRIYLTDGTEVSPGYEL